MHFSEAYQLLIMIGVGGLGIIDGTTAHMGEIPTLLQGQEAEDNDDTVTTLTNALGSMTMSNNANAQAVQNDVSVLRAKITNLHVLLNNRGSSLANNSSTAGTPTQMAPPAPYAMANNPPPMYQAPAQQPYMPT